MSDDRQSLYRFLLALLEQINLISVKIIDKESVLRIRDPIFPSRIQDPGSNFFHPRSLIQG